MPWLRWGSLSSRPPRTPTGTTSVRPTIASASRWGRCTCLRRPRCGWTRAPTRPARPSAASISWAWTHRTSSPNSRSWCAPACATGCGSTTSRWIAWPAPRSSRRSCFATWCCKWTTRCSPSSTCACSASRTVIRSGTGRSSSLRRPWGSPRSRFPPRQRSRRNPCTSTNPRTSPDPIPTPGFAATWVLSKHFYLDGRVQSLHLHIKEYDGTLGTAELAALYRFRPNVSFALGYTEVKSSSRLGQDPRIGILRLQYQRTRDLRQGFLLVLGYLAFGADRLSAH